MLRLGDLHQLEIRVFDGSKKQISGDRLYNCINYEKANYEEKRAIFLRAKSKLNQLCTNCTSWRHDSSNCKSTGKCKFCNNKHHSGACALQKLVSCANVGSKLVKLCVQDIPAISNFEPDRKTANARVLFDLGSQTTLVRDHFAEQLGWS